jgi:gamma-butyrobetaine dioxygenase
VRFAEASVQPRRADTIEEARLLVARDGAAIVSGVRSVAEVTGYGVAILARDGVLVRPQCSTRQDDGEFGMTASRRAPESRGRVIRSDRMNEDVSVHNDGITLGDMSPDYILLWAEVACPIAGESVLVDGVKLIELLAAKPEHRELVDFCWNVPIDVSGAFRERPEPSFIARRTSHGRQQVRCHLDLRALEGPEECERQALIDQWVGVVREAEAQARTFRLETEQIVVIDNYRLLHGRRAYVNPECRITSVWAWSNRAVGVPLELPIREPSAALPTGDRLAEKTRSAQLQC